METAPPAASGPAAGVAEDELRQVVAQFIKGKELGGLRFSDVRAYVEKTTRALPPKELLKEVIRSVLESQTASEDEAAASESRTSSASDDEEKPPAGRAQAGGGFKTPCFLSPALQAVVGVEEASRAEVTKKLWDYIKKHNLQDPAKRNEIICDSKFRDLFKRDRVSIFKMNKHLSAHIKTKKEVSSGVKVEERDEEQEEEEAEEEEEDDDEEEDEDEDEAEDDDEEDEDEDEDETPKKRKAPKQQKPNARSSKKVKLESKSGLASKKVKLESKSGSARGGGGFSKSMLLVSPLMQDFLHSETTTRPQAVKAIWDHIKLHGLQNPSNKREILCDEALEKLFRRKTVTMFSLNMFLTVHLKKTSEQGAGAWDYSKLDLDDAEWRAAKEEASGPATRKSKPVKTAKSSKGRGNGFSPVKLSDQLAKFMGRAMATRGEVVKALWAHIKLHGLQNESNRQEIICDAVLTELLGQARVTQFGMNKPLQRHFIKAGPSSSVSSDDDEGDEG